MRLGDAQPSQSKWPLRIAVIVAALMCMAFHFAMALKGFANYRDQHLGTAIEYAKGRIDPLHPVIIGFNANNTATPLEFPIWQVSTAMLFKTFGIWLGWASLISLLFGFSALWPLYKLAKAYSDERAAWWTLLFYVLQPLVFYYNGCGSTDGSCLTFAIWFLYFADLLVRTGQARWFLPSVISGGLSAVTKAPFFFCVGLTSIFLLLIHGRRDVRRWSFLIATGIASLLIFLLWDAHTKVILAGAEFPLVDLRLSAGEDGGEFMRDWLFGDWQYRLALRNWIKGGWRFLTSEFGSFAMSGLMIWGAISSRYHIGQALLLAGGLTTLVFTHLVLHHSHYYLMFSPAVAMLCAVATGKLESILRIQSTGLRLSVGFVGMFCVILGLSTAQGLTGMKIGLIADPYPNQIAQLVQQHTSANDKLLIQGGGWGGDILMRSDRRGLSIWSTKFLEQPRNFERIQKLGFNKLVMISESPLLLALQQTNPGHANQQRNVYTNHLTVITESWPVLLKTDDILIKEIPQLRRN